MATCNMVTKYWAYQTSGSANHCIPNYPVDTLSGWPCNSEVTKNVWLFFGYATLANVTSDVAVALVPLSFLMNLQMSISQKVGILFMFALGAM